MWQNKSAQLWSPEVELGHTWMCPGCRLRLGCAGWGCWLRFCVHSAQMLHPTCWKQAMECVPGVPGVLQDSALWWDGIRAGLMWREGCCCVGLMGGSCSLWETWEEIPALSTAVFPFLLGQFLTVLQTGSWIPFCSLTVSWMIQNLLGRAENSKRFSAVNSVNLIVQH